MSELPHKLPSGRSLSDVVSRKQRRRLESRGRPERTIWFGLGMFGLIGWSVAIPALVGIAAGVWIDHRWPSRYSWTLMLLIGGVCLGCMNAWRWIRQEGRVDGTLDGPDIADNEPGPTR